MKVIAPGDVEIDLGITEATPSIGITDYSRRETDDFGVTAVVPRKFARRMTLRFKLPSASVDDVQQTLADLRAVPAQWVASEDFAWLNFEGFYKDFSIDHAAGEASFCSLTVEGLAESETVTDSGEDPSPVGASSLMLIQPAAITTGTLVASNVPETDWPEWSNITVYAHGAKVIKAATHRIYESAVDTNVGNDPAGTSGKWIDVGPTNRWAMFDEALGTVTTRADSIAVTLDAGTANAVALLDVVGATVRVQKGAYDQTKAVTSGAITFLDVPAATGNIVVTVSGSGSVTVGTLVVGQLVMLGITEASPTSSIADYSRKEFDDFGEPTIVERAWSKRMTAAALIDTAALDIVANRIAAVRAKPAIWIGRAGTDALTIYGFFKDFGIEVGQTVSKLSLSVEGLSKAAPAADQFEGLSIVEKSFYKRSASAPATPTGGSFDFDTMTATPPAGWSVSVPAGDDPAYVVSAIASKEGPGGSADFGGYSPPVIAFENGEPGSDGAPGAPGADGVTLYTWYAYADAPDGTFNFTTGAPGSRVFQGVATGKTTATESTDPADYSWSPYVGPPNFGLAAFDSNSIVAGNKLIKVAGGTGWNASIHSTESFKGGASVSFVVDTADQFMVGLNTDPTTDASYTSLDFAIYITSTNAQIYQSGAGIFTQAEVPVPGDVFTITYNNKTVVYSKNGVPFYTNTSPAANLTLFLDSALAVSNRTFGRILAFTAAGTAGTDGAPGAPGADGTSPLLITVSPSSLTVQGAAGGAPAAGELPKVVGVTAQRGGVAKTVTAISVTTATNCTASVSGASVSLNTAGAGAGEIIISVTADGETQTGIKIPVSVIPAGADGDVAATISSTTPQVTSSTYAAWSPALATNASDTGKLKVSGSCRYRVPLGSGSLQVQAKLQISADGSTWTDISGTQVTGTTSDTVTDPDRVIAGAATFPEITVTGLTAAGAYQVRGQLRKVSSGDTNSESVTLRIVAEKVA